VVQLDLALDRPVVDEGPARATQVAEEGLAVALLDGAVPVADPVAGRAEVAAGVAAHEELRRLDLQHLALLLARRQDDQTQSHGTPPSSPPASSAVPPPFGLSPMNAAWGRGSDFRS
jgi:hypothetical protein